MAREVDGDVVDYRMLAEESVSKTVGRWSKQWLHGLLLNRQLDRGRQLEILPLKQWLRGCQAVIGQWMSGSIS